MIEHWNCRSIDRHLCPGPPTATPPSHSMVHFLHELSRPRSSPMPCRWQWRHQWFQVGKGSTNQQLDPHITWSLRPWPCPHLSWDMVVCVLYSNTLSAVCVCYMYTVGCVCVCWGRDFFFLFLREQNVYNVLSRSEVTSIIFNSVWTCMWLTKVCITEADQRSRRAQTTYKYMYPCCWTGNCLLYRNTEYREIAHNEEFLLSASRGNICNHWRNSVESRTPSSTKISHYLWRVCWDEDDVCGWDATPSWS